VICYLDRGVGAVIRGARTRLPGGGDNPVAIIRVPRERMIGSGIASSLIHEVGHQAAALLGLVASLKPVLQTTQRSTAEPLAWQLWERWISEIVSDFWSIAKVGVVSTLGLIGVVSLPRPFVFRLNFDDPHPIPWIPVKLSCAIGNALYRHPQWQKVADLWKAYYSKANSRGAVRSPPGVVGNSRRSTKPTSWAPPGTGATRYNCALRQPCDAALETGTDEVEALVRRLVKLQRS
jgi:hypothetical protein